jgi:primosomal protein N'
LHGRYRWQLLLLGREVRPLHHLCANLLQQAPARLSPGVTIAADVDPENML